jgi:hypothetical protein
MIPSSSLSYSLAEERFRLYTHLATRMLSFDAPARWACLSGKLWIHPPAYCATEQSSSIRYSIIAVSPRAVIIIADITHPALTEFHDALTTAFGAVKCWMSCLRPVRVVSVVVLKAVTVVNISRGKCPRVGAENIYYFFYYDPSPIEGS